MSNYFVNGVDLDSIFAPLTGYTPAASITNFKVGEVDLNQRYLPIAAGVAAAATNFKNIIPDLNTIFSGKLSGYHEYISSGNWTVPYGVNNITVVVAGAGGGGYGYYNSFFGAAIRVRGQNGGNSTLTSSVLNITANGGEGGDNGVAGLSGGYSVSSPPSFNISRPNYNNVGGYTEAFIHNGFTGRASGGGAGRGGGGGSGGYLSTGGDGALNISQGSVGSGFSSYTGGGGGGQNGDGGRGGGGILAGITTPTTQAGGTPSSTSGIPMPYAPGSVYYYAAGGGQIGGFGGGGGGGALVWATNISVTYGTVFTFTPGVGGNCENGSTGNGYNGGVAIMYGTSYDNFPFV
jgi:hypothetical protein